MKEAGLKILGDYVISNTIGKGTFSKVKLGVNKLTKERVAIKIIEKANIKEKDDLERVKREIEILNNIRHSNVIKIYTVLFANIGNRRRIQILYNNGILRWR
jgi:serine/threonine protein kinase